MQFARSIFDRTIAQTIIPMVTMGVSGAIAAALMELLRDWHEERVSITAKPRS
jgi:hypothetical protein